MDFFSFEHHFEINLFLFLCSVTIWFVFCLRLDELRHRLIPLYNYDPTERQEEWDSPGREEEELTVSKPLKRY